MVIPIIPFGLSSDSKRNAFCFHCDTLEQRQHYALCIHKMKLRKVSALKDEWSECSSAIKKKTCQALQMDQDEIYKGQSLFFAERVTSDALSPILPIQGVKSDALSMTNKVALSSKKPAIIKQVNTDGLEFEIDTGGYEDAINKSKPKIEIKDGESILAFAKRLKSMENNQ